MSCSIKVFCVLAAALTSAHAGDDLLATVASVAEKAVKEVDADKVAQVSNDAVAAVDKVVSDVTAQSQDQKPSASASANSSEKPASNQTSASVAAATSGEADAKATITNGTGAAAVAPETKPAAKAVGDANEFKPFAVAPSTPSMSSDNQTVSGLSASTDKPTLGGLSVQWIALGVFVALSVVGFVLKRCNTPSASPYMTALNSMRQEEGKARNVELDHFSTYNQFA